MMNVEYPLGKALIRIFFIVRLPVSFLRHTDIAIMDQLIFYDRHGNV